MSQHLTPGYTGVQAQLKRSHAALSRNARVTRQDVGQAASAVRDLLRAIDAPSAGDISECINCCSAALLEAKLSAAPCIMLQTVHSWQCLPDAAEDGAVASIVASDMAWPVGCRTDVQLLTA